MYTRNRAASAGVHRRLGEEAMTDTDTAMTRLRMTAIEQLVGRHVGSDRLIQIGLDALLAGLDTPLLRLWQARVAGSLSRIRGVLSSPV